MVFGLMRDQVDGRRSVAVRLLVCGIVMASVLVPSLAAPARVIKVPVTLTRTVREKPEPARIVQESFDFAPTHIGFSWTGDHGTGVLYRTISALGERSRWRRAREAHDAEGISEGAAERDSHFSAVLAVDRPEAIEWKPVVARGQTMGTVTLDYLNTLDGPDRLVEIPATAGARASAPDVVTRAQWGADESLKRTSGSCRRKFYPVQQLFVHHTAGSNLGGRWARRYKPWELHDSESPAGNAVAGAHVARFNSGSVGVSLMGNYTSIRPSPAMYQTLVEFLAWEADRHDLRPRGTHRYRNPETRLTRRLPVIAGHRDAGQTACPGNRVYRSMSAIRRDTSTVIGAGKTDSRTTLAAGRSKVTYGQRASLTGVLTNSSGAPLAGRPIRTFRRAVGGGWRAGPQGVTRPDGAFTLTLSPKRTLRIVAIYDGDASTWGSESPAVTIRVAPI